MTVRIKHKGLPALLRMAVLVLLFLFVILVGLTIISNLKNRSHQPSAPVQPARQAGTFSENFQALEFAGEKRHLRLKADNYYTDVDGRQHLEGGVEVSDEELSPAVQLQANAVVMDQEKQSLRADGEVSLEFNQLRILAPLIEYDLKDKVARSEKVRIEHGPLRLSADTLLWRAVPGQIILEGNIAGEKLQPGDSFSFEGERLSFDLEQDNFTAQNLRLSSGGLRLGAGMAEVRLKNDSLELLSIDLSGGAEARWSASSAGVDFRSFDLLADRVVFLLEKNSPVLLARPGFKLNGYGKEWRIQVEGEALELFFEARLSARRLKTGKFLAYLYGNEGETLELSAQNLDYDPVGRKLELSGQALARHEDYLLAAARLALTLPEFGLAGSEFELEIQPSFFKKPVPFFKKELPVFLTGSCLETFPGVFELSGQVRVWQAEDFCLTDKARLEKDRGLLQRVEKASWSARRSDGQEEKVELRAGRVELLAETSQVILSGGLELGLDQLRLRAEEAVFGFTGEVGGGLARLEAKGRVSLDWKEYRASGRQASLDFDSQQLVVTGHPELRAATGERLEADKLTLFLADDRIRLENQKRERSLTVLVRGK
ncbi:MAG: hypothetical protein NUW07_01070 [Candidatus Saccharicenans sp.]|nr:hypothetical protein [Candidatus Saccharicenans sp.]MDH7493168.1 hypothetical protein [Candidatus Saccharicenans sp.]